MSDRRKHYPFDEIEPRRQAIWDERQTFRVPNPGEASFDASKPKFYVLDMFPYPSGEGLHVGHTEGYTATDIVARYKMMKGFNVLHPMGWDAFGLPAEQYAIKTGQHPRVTTDTNVANFRAQLKRVGFNYDWGREVNTTDPGYFKWTQWIFLRIYNSWFDPEVKAARPIGELIEKRKTERPEESEADRNTFIDSHRLAYYVEAPVWWCPHLGTVLANEEVVDGKSEVGGHPVERRPLRQWMLRITAYADRLISELDGLDWPDSIKALQRNWIGRSEGADVSFSIQDYSETITVFTTRPDTLYGATYMVLAPEHPLVARITSASQKEVVETYRRSVASKSDLERTDLAKDKSGVFTGAYAINPVNLQPIPIWIADYVLMGYGTGAIMAVPAHDERDWEFAKKFGLPIKQVVSPTPTLSLAGGGLCAAEPVECFAGEGYAINSAILDGLPTAEAKRTITDALEKQGIGKMRVNFKLRDWLFCRQRYWGEPFPIVWEGGRHRALAETELPLLPPEMEDFKPSGTPEPPLSKAKDWVRYSGSAERETNTMPQWAGSCWYYLRYCDPQNSERFVSQEAERYWMNDGKPGGVDLYIGGTEHAVLHLLYARFWHKVLFDLGQVSTIEPFQRLVNQGIILGEDGNKMSKSRGNVVNPDDVIAGYGADSLRLYEMAMGPLEQMKPWSMNGVEGVCRFLARVWRLVMEETQEGEWTLSSQLGEIEPDAKQRKVLHQTIKKVTEDIDILHFNTAISQMMVFTKEFTAAEVRPVSAIRTLLQLLNPFAPHLTEELWERLGAKFAGFDGELSKSAWPEWNPEYLIEDEIEVVVQVNGKVRDHIVISKDASREETEAVATGSAKLQEWVAGKTIRKVVVVPGKLVNFVVG